MKKIILIRLVKEENNMPSNPNQRAIKFSSSQLRKNNITPSQVLSLSRMWYRSIDDKARRARMDIVGARIIKKTRLTYNRETGRWEQEGNSTKLIYNVRSIPESYESHSTIRVHRYPVTFWFQDINNGMNSVFRWRTGSFAKPRTRGKNTGDFNIKRGIQLQFFYELSYVLRYYGLLYGPNWATRRPTVTNKKMIPFFDKHAYYCFTKSVMPFLSDPRKLRQTI